MQFLNSYRLSLLLTEGKYSCVKASKILPNFSHDQLTRFLLKTPKESSLEIKNLPPGGNLIFDDTAIKKIYSKNLEESSWVWCSSFKKAFKGYCLIKVIYVYECKIYNITDIIWRKGGPTKNELIREFLKELKKKGLNPKTVLFDCFYGACKTLNLINSFGWKYLSLCKSNKIFEKQQVKNFKFYGAKSRIGKARGIYHTVQIAKHCDRYLMTNLDKPLNTIALWKKYKRRWIIETIFKDLKSHLHLEKCSSRSLNAQINHFQASMDVYLYLKEYYPSLSIEAAQQQCLSDFRAGRTLQNSSFKQAA